MDDKTLLQHKAEQKLEEQWSKAKKYIKLRIYFDKKSYHDISINSAFFEKAPDTKLDEFKKNLLAEITIQLEKKSEDDNSDVRIKVKKKHKKKKRSLESYHQHICSLKPEDIILHRYARIKKNEPPATQDAFEEFFEKQLQLSKKDYFMQLSADAMGVGKPQPPILIAFDCEVTKPEEKINIKDKQPVVFFKGSVNQDLKNMIEADNSSLEKSVDENNTPRTETQETDQMDDEKHDLPRRERRRECTIL
jgi:hypothetical protein